jgi:hypothetical protein
MAASVSINSNLEGQYQTPTAENESSAITAKEGNAQSITNSTS